MKSNLLLLLIFVLVSCKNSTGPSSEDIYFDSGNYFAGEVGRLAKEYSSMHKTIRRNSETDSSQLAVTDWKKELEPFSQCNINKPAMRNSYRIDTLIAGMTKSIVYAAKEPALAVQKAEVIFAGDKIIRVQFSTSESNALYHTTRNLVYSPDSGYVIEGTQVMTMGEKTNYFVKASWK